MITLRDKERDTVLGEITEAQWQFLVDQLEEESEDDRDYYINRTTLDGFRRNGADPALLELLEAAMAGRKDMEIEWRRS